jgi:prepilin-type processing-associated H-X9-DG protein
VFANARDKARQISDLSNIKEIALSTIMYTNDYDDTFPIGDVQDTNNNDNGQSWVTEILPYLGDIHVLFGTDDTTAGTPAKTGGENISYGVNAVTGKSIADGSNIRSGVFASIADGAQSSFYSSWHGGYTNSVVCKLAEATQPTATILLADLQSADVATYTPSWEGGNSSAFGLTNLIGDRYPVDDGWQLSPTSATVVAPVNVFDVDFQGSSWDNGDALWELPNPYRSPSLTYPAGPNGVVSAPFSSKSLTNFAFLDGHAKALKPAATDPDGSLQAKGSYGSAWDQNNLWNVAR